MLPGFLVFCSGSRRALFNWAVFCIRSSPRTSCLSPATSILTSTTDNSRFFLSSPVQFSKPLLSIASFVRRFVSDVDLDSMAANRYACDYARLGTSSCSKCKQRLEKGGLRLAKLTVNPFSESGDDDRKQYFHPKCLFETFERVRSTTKVIDNPDDVEGFLDLTDQDKDLINTLIKDLNLQRESLKKTNSKKTPPSSTASASATDASETASSRSSSSMDAMSDIEAKEEQEEDDSFFQFGRLCADVAAEDSYNGKTAIIKRYITDGTNGAGFHGDLRLLLKLLLAGDIKRVYNLASKRLVKHFSQIFETDHDEMVEDLEKGVVAETIRTFFEMSQARPPQMESTLTIQEVDEFLGELCQYTRDEDQQNCLTEIADRCTSVDLLMIVRLIKHDLRMNCGTKHVLDAVDPNAYESFKASRNLDDVVDRVLRSRTGTSRGGGRTRKNLSVRANLMTPVQPMLAEACRSLEKAFKKFPNGMYAEIKYDGERVQIHKRGNEFLYFSRSLKPVVPHKVQHFKDFIPQAFPTGADMILDSEVLLIDTKTGRPLPFGTLGVHKKSAFRDANVCLFVFDCLHFNGKNLMHKSIRERRDILCNNIVQLPNRILVSKMEHITDTDELSDFLTRVFQDDQEGLVLKDVEGIYEPGKRHWLKVKKDYLDQGKMADTADLVIVGGYYGTGNNGGTISIFLMGVYDSEADVWCTVTKCGSGFDDKTLKELQKTLKMVKIKKDHSKVPLWLDVTKKYTPDFVIANPKKSLVLEITGAEFSRSDAHTAGGISIRFPRCTKIRDDKTWKEATNLNELKDLFTKSKESPDVARGTPKKKRQTRKKEDDANSSDDKSTQTGKRKKKEQDSEGRKRRRSDGST